MKAQTRNPESGLALFFAIFALLLLAVIGASLMFMAKTETSINSNYRQEQVAYFAAKAGIEEARARMMASDPTSVACANQPSPCAAPVIGNAAYPLFDPAQVASPLQTNHMIYYITNPGAGAAIQPWSSADPYTDDELCHDGYAGLGQLGPNQQSYAPGAIAPDIRCAAANLPANSYVAYTSTLPFSNTVGAVAYKWVRIAPKLNTSVTYLTSAIGAPAATISTYFVNTGMPAANVVCWDGAEELVLKTPNFTNCSQMTSLQNAPLTNVYLVTAMGVSPTGARKVTQAEVALQPTTPFPYGLFATSPACPAISFNGANASTDSYTTAGNPPGTYATTATNTGGDVGSNGGVSVQNGQIGGLVGVLAPPPAGPGTCASPFSIGPKGTDVGPGCPGPNCIANSPTYLNQPYTFSTPPLPNPAPPNNTYNPPACGGKGGGNCMVPGTYGNISTNGTLTLSPGVYNINSLSMAGNGAIVVSPAGAVTLNVAGTGNASPIAIAGNGITDDTNPNDFVINYGGTGTISITGNGNVTAILNAPNSTITQKGNGNWYGAILTGQITIGGNAFFHYDRASALAPSNNGYFQLVSYREVPY